MTAIGTAIGELAVNAVVRTGGVSSGVRTFRSELGSMRDFALSVGPALASIGAAGATAAVALVQSQGGIADALSLTSQKLDLSIEKISQYRYGAKLAANVSGDDLDGALERMNTNVGLAATGSGKAAKSIKELHLNAKLLAELDTDTKLRTIADAIAKVDNAADRTRLAEKIFGDSRFAIVLGEGAAGLRKMAIESDATGATLGTLANDKLAAADDAFDRMGASIGGAAHALGGLLAPAVEVGATVVQELAVSAKDAIDAITGNTAAITSQANAYVTYNEQLKIARANEAALRQEQAAGRIKAFNKKLDASMKAEHEELQRDKAALGNRTVDVRNQVETFGLSPIEAEIAIVRKTAASREMGNQLVAQLEQLDKLTKARELNNKAIKHEAELQERANRIIDQSLTPIDDLKKQLTEISALQASGKLTAEQAEAAATAARKGFSPTAVEGPARRGPNVALEFGSAEALRAIRSAERGDDTPKKQLDELKQANDLAKDTLNAIKNLEIATAAW